MQLARPQTLPRKHAFVDAHSLCAYTCVVPIYEYECTKCGHVFDAIQKVSDKPLRKCEKCSGKVERLISAPAIQFKGTGWYVTDYAKKSGGPESSKSESSKSGDSSESGTSSSKSKDTKTKSKKNAASSK